VLVCAVAAEAFQVMPVLIHVSVFVYKEVARSQAV